MILGLVSNCWHQQLAEGISLEKLISRAAESGYRAIELRQTCLGRFEDPQTFLPRTKALADLPQAFPELRFDLALAFPFLNPFGDASLDRLFETGVAASQALSGRFHPHLRLVDLDTSAERLTAVPLPDLAAHLARLTRRLIQTGGWLSLEHARQPWGGFLALVLEARQLLGEDAPGLRICYDPANLLMASDTPEPTEVVRGLAPETLSMLHLKQFRDQEFQQLVGPGEIDWRRQISVLKSSGYTGPALFEIASHARIWEHLDQSRIYLEGLGASFNRQ